MAETLVRQIVKLDEGKSIPHERVKEEFAEWLTDWIGVSPLGLTLRTLLYIAQDKRLPTPPPLFFPPKGTDKLPRSGKWGGNLAINFGDLNYEWKE